MEIQVRRQMAVSPARVMRALTDPVEVARWAGATLTISETTYQLTGPTLIRGAVGGACKERSATILRFEWVVANEPTEITIEINAVPQDGRPPADWSEVVVTHRSIPDAALGVQYEKETWHCSWIMLVRFLRSWVERGERPDLFRYDGPFPALVEQEILLQAPIAKAWRALVEPDLRRRWLTLDLGPVLAQEEGRAITFSWPEEPGSRVIFRLEPVGPEQTRLALRHEGSLYGGLSKHIGWYDYLVSCYLETAEPVIGRALWLGAPPERIWPQIATQDGLRRWFSPEMQFDPTPGGKVYFESYGSGLYGEVVEVVPFKRVSFTWSEEGVSWPSPTLLTIELTPEGGGTLFRLVHSGFGPLPPKEFESYQRGWADDTWLLDSLRPLVAAG